jgi:hypothetical protein
MSLERRIDLPYSSKKETEDTNPICLVPHLLDDLDLGFCIGPHGGLLVECLK